MAGPPIAHFEQMTQMLEGGGYSRVAVAPEEGGAVVGGVGGVDPAEEDQLKRFEMACHDKIAARRSLMASKVSNVVATRW